jgi:hypothetical protein
MGDKRPGRPPDGFLGKPVEPQDLLDKVAELLA